MTIRLVVTSRCRVVRDAICGFLSGRRDVRVVGQTDSIPALVELCALRRPDAVLVEAGDLTVETVEELRAARAGAPVPEIVVSYTDVSPPAIDAAIRAGITNLVPGSRGLEAVLDTIRQRVRPPRRLRPDGLALTEHDVRVAALLSTGHSVPEIAELLQISPRTVENRKRRLYVKLGVGSSGAAISRAISFGLVGAPGPERRVRREDRGRPPLVVVRGAAGSVLDRVLRTVIQHRLPLVHIRDLAALPQDHWASWQLGPIVTVLVDPGRDDWLVPRVMGARTAVVLSAAPDVAAVVDLLLRGARGLVRAEDVAADLAAVLSVILHGYLALDASYQDGLAGWLGVRLAGGGTAMPELTARERDVLCSIAAGHTTRQTARALGIAAKTVENTLARLYRKLGARNRAEALSAAHRLGLLDGATAVVPPFPAP